MKNFTKTLVAATLALGAVSANASILNDNSGAAEAWLSVYDSTSANTFTLDLGDAGITWDALFPQQSSTGLLQNVSLVGYSDWNAFKASADLSTTKFSVAVGGKYNGFNTFMATGADTSFFQGLDTIAIANAGSAINLHAAGINADTATSQSPLVNDSTLVNDLDLATGKHGNSAGLWDSASFNVDTAYGDMADFNLVTLVTAGRKTSAIHNVFDAKWKLDGDNLTLGSVSAVPVPAAVWMFGSALLGLAGVSRKRKSV